MDARPTEAWQPDQRHFPFFSKRASKSRPGLAFYDWLSNARPFIEQINEHEDQEGPSRDAWRLVAQKYFPEEEPSSTPNESVTWAVVRDDYRRAIEGATLRRPCIIAIKTRMANEQGTPRYYMRDMLVIECQRPNANTESGWLDLLKEAVKRLNRHYSEKSTFLIAAVGSNYMFFLWDQTACAAAALTMSLGTGSCRHTFDPRLRPLGMSPWLRNTQSTSKGSAMPETLQEIDYTGALSILGDCQSNLLGVASLENFLTAVRGAQLEGSDVFK